MEEVMVKKILVCASWGYPLDTLEIRLFVKSVLDNVRTTVKAFHNNLPGNDWIKGFLRRHSNHLSERLVPNIKRVRAEVNSFIVNEFFDNLEISLDGIPPENIINYDETNLSDNPGERKCVVKRGCKHPERVMNSTKASYYIMFAGSAVGEILPSYVVYKAENLRSTWMLNGPSGTRYNRRLVSKNCTTIFKKKGGAKGCYW
jgi:hypothetical protein